MHIPLALLGRSAAAARARDAFDAAGPGSHLIVAEQGLDPDDLARYLHDRTRGGHPLVTIDCAGDDAGSLERDILGARPRLASADIDSVSPGAALLAAGEGTLFLRHVGELPSPVQRRLGRLLRDGEARVGARGRARVDARVIAWTPAPLDADIREGRFRADLLRRFAAPLHVPPLRGRAEDVPAIVEAAAAESAATLHRAAPRFTHAALTVLGALPWTGNVDELRSMLTRLLQRPAAAAIRQEDVLGILRGDGLTSRMHMHVSLREARRRFERDYIAEVLEHYHWRMSDAARILGMARANLYRKTRQLGIVRAPAGRSR